MSPNMSSWERVTGSLLDTIDVGHVDFPKETEAVPGGARPGRAGNGGQ